MSFASAMVAAVRHPVRTARVAKHVALHFTRSGDPLSLDELAGHLSRGNRTISGRRIDSEGLLSVSAAWRAVRLIAETCGSLPLHLMRRTNDIPERATDHPLYHRLQHRPSTYQTRSPFVEQVVTSLCLWNQAYIHAPGFGARRSLYALSPAFCRPRVVDVTEREWILNVNGRRQVLQLGEIVPIDGFRMPGALEGMAVAGMHREAFSLALSAEEFGAKFFASGGRPTGVLSTDTVLNMQQREKLRESFAGLLLGRGGLEAMGELHVLEGGMKYQAISSAPDDSQFLATRKHAVLEIARIFGVPPHKLGEMDRATYANAEQNNQEFLTNTLTPYLIRIEQAINAFLLSERDQETHFVKFSVEGLLRADSAARAAYFNAGRVGGWLTQNEIRRFEDLPRVEGADDLHVALNMAPSDLLREIQQPEASE